MFVCMIIYDDVFIKWYKPVQRWKNMSVGSDELQMKRMGDPYILRPIIRILLFKRASKRNIVT